jgi:hypothetical protein
MSSVISALIAGAFVMQDLWFTTTHGNNIWAIRLFVFSRPVIALTFITGYIGFILALIEVGRVAWRHQDKARWLRSTAGQIGESLVGFAVLAILTSLVVNRNVLIQFFSVMAMEFGLEMTKLWVWRNASRILTDGLGRRFLT